MNKIKLILFGLCLIAFVGIPLQSAHAIVVNPFDDVCKSADNPSTSADESKNSSICATKDQTTDPLTGKNGNGIVIKAIQVVVAITGMVSVIMIIFGSIKYIVSNGDPNSIGSAKSTVVYAVVGLVIALFAQSIIIFVINRI